MTQPVEVSWPAPLRHAVFMDRTNRFPVLPSLAEDGAVVEAHLPGGVEVGAR